MSKYCLMCGTMAPDEANFCMKCGYNFNGAQMSAAPAPVGTPAAVDPLIPVPENWVMNSGVVNPAPVAGYETYNPTFHTRCEYCYFEFNYHTYDLGHRKWYPHGFVYCPRCKKPLRHKLEYEVINPAPPQYVPIQPQPPVPPVYPG